MEHARDLAKWNRKKRHFDGYALARNNMQNILHDMLDCLAMGNGPYETLYSDLSKDEPMPTMAKIAKEVLSEIHGHEDIGKMVATRYFYNSFSAGGAHYIAEFCKFHKLIIFVDENWNDTADTRVAFDFEYLE